MYEFCTRLRPDQWRRNGGGEDQPPHPQSTFKLYEKVKKYEIYIMLIENLRKVEALPVNMYYEKKNLFSLLTHFFRMFSIAKFFLDKVAQWARIDPSSGSENNA